jgi:hypothetical protein
MAHVHAGVDAQDARPSPGDPESPEPLEPDRSLGELVSQMTSDFSDLVSTQLDLAKAEIKEEVSRAGKGAGLLTGGGAAAYLAVLILSFAAAWGLSEAMPTGWAFLIVGVVWAAIAALLVLLGRNQLRTVHPVPPRTKQTIKEDVQWAKQQTS